MLSQRSVVQVRDCWHKGDGCVYELNALKRIMGDEPNVMTRLGAPGDHFLLKCQWQQSWEWVGPKGRKLLEGLRQTCEIKMGWLPSMELEGLAVGLLVFGGGVADVVAELGITDKANSRVDLVWLQRWKWWGRSKRWRDIQCLWNRRSATRRGEAVTRAEFECVLELNVG